ncbi:hypothetical protein Tco_1003618 [Tanacetum coccineum]|uniref:Uncharacterized protein n=1 Tax=Tanacetum coccineum TaxID=301880 RepID=A0ABQ5F9U0_9ASTR
MTEQDSPPPTITAMKIPIIKKGEYDIWSMRMRQYICHTDHNLWDIIVDGDLQEEAAPAGEQSGPPAPKTAKQLTAKRNQERVKSILLLAIPDEYLLKFHNVPDAKSLWAAIKSRFGGNDESKKMQRNVLKHQFENFTTAPNESLDKAYDRFQKLISQLEVHAAPVSKEDINQKFLRSLPPSWSQIALIMRNKPDIDQTDIDDLYNNLGVYEDEMKSSSSSTSNSQNLAFLSSENTSSTNEVSTASGNFGVNTAGRTNSSSQTTSPPLDNEDLQQIDQDDLEELDIRWQVAMLTVRVQRFIQRPGRNLDFKENNLYIDKSKVSSTTVTGNGTFAKKAKSGRKQREISYGDMQRNAQQSEPSSQALWLKMVWEGYTGVMILITQFNNSLMAISSQAHQVLLTKRSSVKKSHQQMIGISKAAWYQLFPSKTGNFLTPRADISFAGLDEYAIRKKIIESKITKLNTDTSKYKTSETVGETNEVKQKKKPMSVHELVVPKPKINRDKVIIEDWYSDDVSEVNTVSPVKTNETQTVKTQVDKISQK